MRLSIVTNTLVALSLLSSVTFFGSQLVSDATPSPSSSSADSQLPANLNSPDCLNLDNVKTPVVEFGRNGRASYSVTIDASGRIATGATPAVLPSSSPIQLKTQRLSPTTVKAIAQLASVESFWKLPKVIGHKSSKSDDSMFMSLNLPCAKHSVTLFNGAKTDPDVQHFAEMYLLLSDLVSGDAIGVRLLQ